MRHMKFNNIYINVLYRLLKNSPHATNVKKTKQNPAVNRNEIC